MDDNIKTEEVIGKINYYGFKGEIAETMEYTDKESYLNAIRKEMDYNPDGFKYVTLTQDPQTRKAVDDVIYDAYGADNPHTMEYYSPKVEDMNAQEKEDLLFVQDKRFSHLYSTLPESRRTYRVSWAAVEADWRNLEFVPEKHIDGEIIKMAAQKEGFAIEMVPSSKMNEEIYKIAVNQNGGALEFVPKALRTPELCFDAVKNNGWALEFVPDNLKTEEMCRTALKYSSDLGRGDYEIMAFIPFPNVCMEGLEIFKDSLDDPHEVFACINPRIMTPEIAMYGVKMEPTCLALVPERLRTPELYQKAIKEDGLLLYKVPEEKRTKELCEAAVQSDFHSMKYVPEKWKTTEFCMKALKRNAFAIQYFPADKLTHEVCQEALEKASHLRILSFIPFKDIHMKVFDEYCKDYSTTKTFLDCMNPKVMNQEFAMKIFEKEPELFYNIPAKFKDKQLCEAAIKHDGYYLKHVPDSQKTKELCELAIKQSPYAIPFILDEMKGKEQYMKMVNDNAKNLNGIPANERTYEMCRIALDNTFGKDKNDVSVVNAIPFPSLLLEVFKAHNDPQKINLLLCIANRDIITPEIAKEAVQKDGSSLFMIPEKAITSEVAEIAIRNYPGSLQWVPEKILTPDMILFTIKKIEGYNACVPENIEKGNNIYAFHKKVEDVVNKPLSYDEHKKLYAGESINVGTVRTHGGDIFPNCVLSYNRESNTLNLKNNVQEQKKQSKEVIKPGFQKPAKTKGRKL